MLGQVIPVLRSFDEKRAKDFYLGYLGFELVFEHRFEPGLPLYMGVRRGTCIIHLSEHYGDGSPGANLRIACDDVRAFHAALAKDDGNARPGAPKDAPWGSREFTVHDPAGNQLTFHTPTAVYAA